MPADRPFTAPRRTVQGASAAGAVLLTGGSLLSTGLLLDPVLEVGGGGREPAVGKLNRQAHAAPLAEVTLPEPLVASAATATAAAAFAFGPGFGFVDGQGAAA